MSVLSRVAAFVVAIGLVVGAVVVRSAREDGTGVTGPVDLLGGDPVVAACAEELRALCGALAGTDDVAWSFDDAADVASAMTGEEPSAALLPAAWADVTDDARRRAGTAALARSEVLASTPLLLVAFQDRASVLAEVCGGTVEALTWSCIGDQAGRRWETIGGDVRWGAVVPGHLPPDTATGLQATTGVIAARTGLPFSLAELRDVSFTSWFGRLERAVVSFTPAGGSHLTAMVTRGPSAANVAVATEAATATRGLDTAFGPLVVVAAEPVLLVELVVAGTDADAVDALAELLAGNAARATFAEAGWRTGDGPVPGAPVQQLPPPSPTPDGGVLTAVRDAWQDAAG